MMQFTAPYSNFVTLDVLSFDLVCVSVAQCYCLHLNVNANMPFAQDSFIFVSFLN